LKVRGNSEQRPGEKCKAQFGRKVWFQEPRANMGVVSRGRSPRHHRTGDPKSSGETRWSNFALGGAAAGVEISGVLNALLIGRTTHVRKKKMEWATQMPVQGGLNRDGKVLTGAG